MEQNLDTWKLVCKSGASFNLTLYKHCKTAKTSVYYTEKQKVVMKDIKILCVNGFLKRGTEATLCVDLQPTAV